MHELDEVLLHVGVKGMKWGVRKDRNRSSKPKPKKAKRSYVLDTKSGEKLTVEVQELGIVAKGVGRLSKSIRNEQARTTFVKAKNSSGKVVGDGQMYMEKDNSTMNLVWVGIKKSQRGKGYASSMLKLAEAEAKRQGAKKLTLEVPADAPDAQHIYSKQGFKLTGKTLDDSSGAWGGELRLMEKTIKQSVTLNQVLRHNGIETMERSGSMHELDDFIQHAGVKGMKWGVRKDRSGSKSERKAQKLQAKMEKKDAKWARKGSRDAFINTWNDANQKINPWIREQNKKPEYKNLDMRKDGPKQRKYIKEYEQKVTSELNKSAQKLATSPSGKKRLEFKFDVDSGPTMKIVDVKDNKNLKQSADLMSYLSSLLEYEDVEYMDSYPDDIVLQSDSDDVLLHVGVKGMKWGVRKDRSGGKSKKGSDDAPKEKGAIRERLDSRKREREWETLTRRMHKMSTEELQFAAKRSQIETEYQNLVNTKVRIGNDPLKTRIATREERKLYRNRDKMTDVEISREVTRLRAKNNIVNNANKASAKQREVGKRVANVAGTLAINYAVKRSIDPSDIVSAVANSKKNPAANAANQQAQKAAGALVGKAMGAAAARAAR